MRKYSLFLLLLVSTASTAQTCIILYANKEAIYVGADSRGAAFESVPGSSPSVLCKINSVGRFNFAISGVGFPIALEECKKAAARKATFPDVINDFAPKFISRLQETLEIARTTNLQVYRELTIESDTVSSVIFFGIEADSFYIAKVKFVLNTKENTPVHISGSGGPYATKHLNEGSPLISAMGLTNEIKDQIFDLTKWKSGVVKRINELINIEIAAHKTKVAKPIDIIKFSKKGISWIQRKPVCIN